MPHTPRTILMMSILSLTPGLIFSACTGVPPANLGVKDGKLAPCPATPNCVSSQGSDQEHAVEPLRFMGPRPQAVAAMKNLILHMKRTSITEEQESYLRAEFTSAVFRFVDDVEFFFDDDSKTIQVRSSSRLGNSDFGVNRRRIEEIRKLWNAPAAP